MNFYSANSLKLQTTSGEDVRDFTKLLRNKLMSRKSKKNSRLGYLPVQVICCHHSRSLTREDV